MMTKNSRHLDKVSNPDPITYWREHLQR